MIETLHQPLPAQPKFNSDGLNELPGDGLSPLIGLLAVGDKECRWPYPAEDGMPMCCGRAVQTGKRYCQDHHLRTLPSNKQTAAIATWEDRKKSKPVFMPLSIDRLGL